LHAHQRCETHQNVAFYIIFSLKNLQTTISNAIFDA